MFNRNSELLKPALAWLFWCFKQLFTGLAWLAWQCIAFAASVLSFGYIDLYKKRDTHGAAGRVWSFFYPFLLSTDKWIVSIPRGIPVPWAKRFKTELTPKTVAMPFAWMAAGAAAYLFITSPAAAGIQTALGDWFIVAELIGGLAIFRKFWQSLPKPDWQEHSLPLPGSIAGRQLFSAPEFIKAWLLIGLSGLGIYFVNMLAVQMNGLNGAFMNSITEKNAAAFTQILWSFATVLGIYTILGPVYSYVKNLLTLEWTMFTTRFMMRLYMTKGRHYYPISLSRNPDNPNERIQQDVPAMCSAAMSFMFSIVDSVVTFFLFGSVLWKAENGLNYNIPIGDHVYHIQHLLLWILIGYALLGSNGVVRVGARLIGLQAKQKQLGADYRVGMVMFEKYAEPIAAYRGETREYNRLWWRFMLSLKNNYAIVRWQRNLGFFTSGYGQVASLLPYAALAPFYFAGQVAFGTISQASGAFGEILASASIFVSQFSSLTGLMASVNRVGELRDELERVDNAEKDGTQRIKIEEDSSQLVDIDHLTLYTPDREKIIIKDFNLHMLAGRNVAIVGESGSGKTSLLRAIVGLPQWDRGEGTIRVPGIGERLMLTQLAYLPMDATLRDQMQYPSAQNVSEEELRAVIKQVNLPDDFIERVGGFDSIYNWDKLSGGERQRLVVARALINKVRLVIADEATSGLDAKNEENLYQQMIAHDMTLLSVTHKPGLMKFHQDVVRLLGDGKGGWTMSTVETPGK